MSIMAKSEGGSFREPELGTHAARCYQIIDLGVQKNEYEGKVTLKHQVLIGWELPKQEPLEDGRPMAISKFYTLSLHEKANLGGDLATWRGRAFTEEEKAGFDITVLVDVPCMLSIIDKKGKAKVGSVMGLPQGMDVPELTNNKIVFSMEDYILGDTTVFDKLSEGIKKMILKSESLKTPPQQPENPAADMQEFDDDIPF